MFMMSNDVTANQPLFNVSPSMIWREVGLIALIHFPICLNNCDQVTGLIY